MTHETTFGKRPPGQIKDRTEQRILADVAERYRAGMRRLADAHQPITPAFLKSLAVWRCLLEQHGQLPRA